MRSGTGSSPGRLSDQTYRRAKYHRSGKQGKYKPDVELDTEVDDGDGNIYKGGYDGEHQVLEEVVDGTGSPIHHPQHLPGLAGQVPLQAQLMDVPEQGDLNIWLKGKIQDSDNDTWISKAVNC